MDEELSQEQRHSRRERAFYENRETNVAKAIDIMTDELLFRLSAQLDTPEQEINNHTLVLYFGLTHASEDDRFIFLLPYGVGSQSSYTIGGETTIEQRSAYFAPSLRIPNKHDLHPNPERLSKVYIEQARREIQRVLVEYNRLDMAELLIGPGINMGKFLTIEAVFEDFDQESIDVIDAKAYLRDLYIGAVVLDSLRK